MAWKALRQLGPTQVAQNGLYQLGLRFNRFQVEPPDPREDFQLHLENLPPISLSEPITADPQLLAEADLLLVGQVRLYGGEPVPLNLDPGGPLRPWAEVERATVPVDSGDIKDIWEPARFCWAVPLARAFHLMGDSRYAQAFWQAFETFTAANPAYMGPNWTSGQEVAMRILTWAFSIRSLASSPESTPQRMAGLAYAIAAHAQRIPPTLLYARSQRNNHLLSEAAGLYTAGCLLGKQTVSQHWRKLGWQLFNRALQDQFEPDGAYIQQSVNYHRLALQEALWMDALARQNGDIWPAASQARLAGAVRWLLARIDPISGRVPNFGHQDGASLFPFGEFSDYRPVAQAASRAFLNAPALPVGEWDAFSGWLGGSGRDASRTTAPLSSVQLPEIHLDSSGIILRSGKDRGVLRATCFQYRPGQSDQLHLDLWHNGQNIALDAGTYRYNAPTPWENALTSALVHNSVTIDGIEPMTRAGRFLWLDWDQAQVIQQEPGRVIGERSGYQKMGLRHRRLVQCIGEGEWLIEDSIEPSSGQGSPHISTLHWLLPDWPWQMEGGQLRLQGHTFALWVNVSSPSPHTSQLIRAGSLLFGSGDCPPTAGWFSETYAHKQPALAYRVSTTVSGPVTFSTTFRALDNPPGVR